MSLDGPRTGLGGESECTSGSRNLRTRVTVIDNIEVVPSGPRERTGVLSSGQVPRLLTSLMTGVGVMLGSPFRVFGPWGHVGGEETDSRTRCRDVKRSYLVGLH